MRQKDTAWTRALLGRPSEASAEGADVTPRLLAALPGPERSAWAAEFVSAHGPSHAFGVLGVCAVPWAPT